MDKLFELNVKFVICGDVNVNLLNADSDKRANALINLFTEYNMRPTISEPTRYSRTCESCIDNIFTNIDQFSVNVINNTISDHTFQVFSTTCDENKGSGVWQKNRDFSNNNIERFIHELSKTD